MSIVRTRCLSGYGVMSLLGLLSGLLSLTACHHQTRAGQYPKTPQPTYGSASAKSSGHLPPPALAVGYTEQGTASWYGIPYNGRPAADGEIYDMETLVAAHRTMPFNTWVRVTNLNNSRTVDVRVIDRGPFVGNRIIDLSKAAARQIDLLGPGIGTVKLEVISAPSDIRSNEFYSVQVGAFSVYENADRARAEYAERFGTAQLALKQGVTPLYRVLVGKVSSMAAAQTLADQLRGDIKGGVFVVRLDQTVPPVSAPAVGPSASEPALNMPPNRN